MTSELRKLNILLINPPGKTLIPKQPKFPNLGLAYIGASLLEEGHNVKILDIKLNRYKKREVKKIIKSEKYDLYGIGCMVVDYVYAVFLSKIIKKYHPNSLIVAGGSVASSIPEILLRTSKVDIAVLGEGEFTIKDITKKITENDTDYSTIDGIYFRKNGQIIKTKDRKPIENLDLIPMPAIHLFNTKEYIKPSLSLTYGHMILCTSRGCPYNCIFCYNCYQGLKVRRHSTERIIKEIKLIVQKYGNVNIYIVDDNFALNKKQVFEFCDAIERENLNVIWSAFARVDVMDDELVKRMKECGCVCLTIGVESGSQTILNNLKKQTTVEQAKNAILLCQKYGIEPFCTFLIGSPGENLKTVMETYKFIKELNLDTYYNKYSFFFFFVLIPYPKTEIYEYAKKNGLITNEVKLIKSLKNVGWDLRINFSELSDKKLYQLKRSIEHEFNYSKIFFKNYFLDLALGKYFKIIFSSQRLKRKIIILLNYFLDMTLGKYFTIIFTSKSLKAKIINLLKFKLDRDLTPELYHLKYRWI